ncbi:GNAT family N-acetyltransferase [Streptomyces syringium]|uniref:GNAT family N-acetyltransferase n=1 Tax=Streptomyces syringium TaxID=76729 RepID=UPI003D93BF4C
MSDLIIPTGIPQFVGELGTLEKEAKSLASNAKLFRDSGAGVHASFQGLSACYKAPEADKLFATTAPVATKSDDFADDLEKVSSALDTYASEVRPLVAKLASLKEQAIAFVASVENDDDWRKDKKKTDRNDELWHSVNATVDAFHAAERACHAKIIALVANGTPLIPDDGSHKPNMYGYKASDLDRAEETPWGSLAEREYTGLAWLRHQAKSFLWDGLVMDGIVGTAKGVATLFGSEGWGKAGEAWTGLAKLATGVIITMTPLSGAYWMASDDQLPGWFRDSRTTMKGAGKAFVAYDQWGKNPARAAGGVTFNVLTTITGGAGAAAKGGAAAKTFAAAGKVGRLIDPITYVGKAGKFTFVKVGDLMSSLKTLNPGASLRVAGETFRLADEATTARLAERPAGLPKDVAEFVDNKGRPVYMNPKTGQLFDEHGKVKQPAESVPREGSAAERAAEHARASQPEKVPVGAGARAGSDVTASVGRTGDNVAGSTARAVPGGAAHDLGHGPSASHGTQGTSSGSHTAPHHGGGHDAPGSGTGGHGSGEHGDTPSTPHGHDGPSGTPHDADGAHNPKTDGADSNPGSANSHDGDAPRPPRRPVGDFVPKGGSNLTPEQLQEGLQQALSGEYGGLRIKVDAVYPMGNTLGWSAHFVDAAGNPVGRMERDFVRQEDGTLAVKHLIMKIDDPAYRGKGVGTAISRELENWYRQSGVSEIRLTAGKENGAYTWARRGYSWANEKSAARIINRVDALMKDTKRPLSKEEFEAAQDIVNRARQNPYGSALYPAPREIARIGRKAGHEDFFGKRVLLGQHWEGRKRL